MADGSVETASASWGLASPHDGNTQGLVVSGFSQLPTGRALFLELQNSGGAWLRTLQQVAPITDSDGRDQRCAALAFTWVGLQKIGLPQTGLDSFDPVFCQGMMQEDRLRRLGDRKNGAWQETVIVGGPLWSANTPQRDAIDGVAPSQTALTATGHTEEEIVTPQTVHALLLLYERDDATADQWCQVVGTALAPFGVKVVRRLSLDLHLDTQGVGHEHFGFADGLSQPVPYDALGAVLVGGKASKAGGKWNGVPLGEILIGHVNGHHEVAPGPAVPDSAQVRQAKLLPHPQAEGSFDFGLDGSYMVVRELRQDVGAFWKSMQAAADHMNLRDPKNNGGVTPQWVAERVLGRDLAGNLLVPQGTRPFAAADNEFGFYDTDPHGLGCPVGSHIRRGNPRDGLAVRPQDAQTLLDSTKNHRILRRGRKFGPLTTSGAYADAAERGLLFMCFNTDISRQFEFVQQTWMLNPNFATLYDQTDPLMGPAGNLTIPQDPLRQIIPVDTFVHLAGGDYFFLPSLPALTYLAAL